MSKKRRRLAPKLVQYKESEDSPWVILDGPMPRSDVIAYCRVLRRIEGVPPESSEKTYPLYRVVGA